MRGIFFNEKAYGVLSNIAKHSVDLAESVVEADILPKILLSLKDIDPLVRKQAATLVREVVKHTAELAQMVVSQGGVGAHVEFIVDAEYVDSLSGVMALGYLAAYSETLALAVIKSEAVSPLYSILANVCNVCHDSQNMNILVCVIPALSSSSLNLD